MNFSVQTLDWEKMDNLLPVIVQHAHTGTVLMLGYMNPESLQETLNSKKITFYSRSKQRLWLKGETSGHTLALVSITPDCDNDALLIFALPTGNICHRDTESCFQRPPFSMEFITYLEKKIKQRQQCGDETSYVKNLLKGGVNRIAQKVGEEAVETALAAVTSSNQIFCYEVADLFFHLLVLIFARGNTFLDIIDVLKSRS